MKSFARIILLAGFFLTIFGAKLNLISVAGSDLPTWDQWDSEGELTFRPWLEGRLSLKDLFIPHSEHRIVTTKLYTLGLLATNGQWDAFVETTFNAAIHALSAIALLLLARRWINGPWLIVFASLLLLLFSLPFSSENTLVGFQVQFYFLLLFSLLQISLTLESNRFTWRWGLGQACAVLGFVSMATGFLSSVAVLAVLGFRLIRERRLPLQPMVTAGIALALTLAGCIFRNEVSAHDALKANSSVVYVVALAQLVSWPAARLLPWSLILLLPVAMFTIRRLKQRELTVADGVLLGLQAWVFLQIAAIAYARGVAPLSSRYLDLVSIGVAVSFILIVREFAGRPRLWIAGLWLVVVSTGLLYESRQRWEHEIKEGISRHAIRESNVRAYLHTDDTQHLLNKPFGDLPYPSGEALIQRLSWPAIRHIMPPSVRNAVPVLADEGAAPRGLPPPLVTPAFTKIFSTWEASASEAPVVWRSAVQPATTLPILRFRIAGNLGAPNRALRLAIKSASGESIVQPDSAAAPGNWKTVNVFRPEGEWWIEVTDAEPGAWFAFTEPVELGRLTWLAQKILKHHSFIFWCGGCLLVVRLGIWMSSVYPTLRRRLSREVVLIGGAIAVTLTLMAIGWFPRSPPPITPLANLTEDNTTNVSESHWLSHASIISQFPNKLEQIGRFNSYIGGDGYTGEKLTGWYTATPRVALMVAGYPSIPGNRLELEVRLLDGTTTTVAFTGNNPREAWARWDIKLPQGAAAIRLRAIDNTTSWGGWLGFSAPFAGSDDLSIDLAMIGQTLATVAVSVVLILGPGLVWRARRKSGFMDVLWPGPLWLATGGLVCWGLGGLIPPAVVAVAWVVPTLLGCLWLLYSQRIWTTWSGTERAVIALIPICVLGATAKAAFSGGSPGELYHDHISRTLEIGDRGDSRISFHTVQLVANHLSPNNPEGAKYFAPWHFSARGPLMGLAAAPIVLATGGQVPLDHPDQAWAPFDPEGFATYRIVAITLAALSLIAISALLLDVADERRAWLGTALFSLTPFFWHEMYFTWPKLITAAWLLAAFQAVHKRHILRSAVWLATAYLWHPLALLSAPFLALWLVRRGPNTFRRRFGNAALFGVVTIILILAWQLINGRNPSQGGFLQYFRAADGVYNVSALEWWSSRWTSFANTFVPFYVLIFNSGHPAFNAIGSPSSGWVHFFFQYWTALPFAVGLLTGAALLPTFICSIKRQPIVAAVVLIGPVLLLSLYWGIATTGLMREAGHVIFLSGWVFLAWAAGNDIPAWILSPGFAAVRGLEVAAMMFMPALTSNNWGGLWLRNDIFWFAVAVLCIGMIAWATSRRDPESILDPTKSAGQRLRAAFGSAL